MGMILVGDIMDTTVLCKLDALHKILPFILKNILLGST
jgi:hypothetical protein